MKEVDEWLQDKEWECHTLQMLAVSIMAAIMVIGLVLVWVIGTEEGFEFLKWLIGLPF
jgi:hypothetical protein